MISDVNIKCFYQGWKYPLCSESLTYQNIKKDKESHILKSSFFLKNYNDSISIIDNQADITMYRLEARDTCHRNPH